MKQFKLTAVQADAAYSILVQHAGEKDNEQGDERASFIYHVATCPTPTEEYRFMGALGMGGKFRNNGNKATPYVDCYPEEMTAARQDIIARTNAALEILFASD